MRFRAIGVDRDTFFLNFEHSAAKGNATQNCVKGNNYAAPDCDSCDSDLVLETVHCLRGKGGGMQWENKRSNKIDF